MSSSTSHEFSALTGAYVLDALDVTERAAFEAHLAGCAECSAEVASLRAAATELSHTSAADPPPQLRADVLSAIGQLRPLPPATSNVIGMRARAARRWVWQAVAAACLLLAAAGGVYGYQQHQDAENSHERTTAITRVLDSHDATTIAGPVGGGHATIVYSKDEQRIVLIAQNIPQPEQGKTYQLWMINKAGHATSGGTFTPNSSGHVLVLASGSLAGVAKMGISVEPSGGSPQPTPGAIIAEMAI